MPGLTGVVEQLVDAMETHGTHAVYVGSDDPASVQELRKALQKHVRLQGAT